MLLQVTILHVWYEYDTCYMFVFRQLYNQHYIITYIRGVLSIIYVGASPL